MIVNISSVDYVSFNKLENAFIVDLIRQMLQFYSQPHSDIFDIERLFSQSGLEQFCRWAKKYKNLTVEAACWQPPRKDLEPVLILDFTEDEFLTLALLKFKENSSDHTS